jgi:hypothetical protein
VASSYSLRAASDGRVAHASCRADILLNSWAVFVTRQLSASAPTLAPALSTYAADWSALADSLVPQWRAAVKQQLVQDAQQARSMGNGTTSYSDWDTLAWARSVVEPVLALLICMSGIAC